MARETKIQYRVHKVEIQHRQCGPCNGTGKREFKIGGIWKTMPCQHCRNGVAIIEHITEVDLKTALNEMGIYNTIRNTVLEILSGTDTESHVPSQQKQINT